MSITQQLEKQLVNAQSHSETDAKNINRVQLIVFRQGNEEYGLQIDQIKEVVLTPPVTRMPQTPTYVKGVANVRGNIIAILDLEMKFGLKNGLESQTDNQRNYTLVVESENLKMGVLVKEVPNTLSVAQSEIDESVNVMQDSAIDAGYIKGIVKSGQRLIILIDIFKVLNENEYKQILNQNV